MTLIGAEPLLDTSNALRADVWCEVEKGFWVGNGDGRFLGSVERLAGDRFLARGDMRAEVGVFPTVADAITAVNEISEMSWR